jgi:hypothetical protein
MNPMSRRNLIGTAAAGLLTATAVNAQTGESGADRAELEACSRWDRGSP